IVRPERVLLLVGVLRAAAVHDRMRAPREGLVVGQQRSALARRQDLGGLMAERAEVADAAGPLVAPALAMGMRAILDHGEAVACRDLHQAVHVGHVMAEVHGYDRAR